MSALLDERLNARSAPPKTKAAVPVAKVPQEAAIAAEVTASTGDAKDEAIINDYVKSGGKLGPSTFQAVAAKNETMETILANKASLGALPKADRTSLRTDTYLVSSALQEMSKKNVFDKRELTVVTDYRKALDSLTKFIPIWVKIGTALALGIGTMIGWQRILKTVGEKILSEHLTYGQGASAELVAYATIVGADMVGLPVSTTHVVSSGITGTMAANRSGLQGKTLRDIGLACILTLPFCVFFGSMNLAAGLLVVVKIGVK